MEYTLNLDTNDIPYSNSVLPLLLPIYTNFLLGFIPDLQAVGTFLRLHDFSSSISPEVLLEVPSNKDGAVAAAAVLRVIGPSARAPHFLPGVEEPHLHLLAAVLPPASGGLEVKASGLVVPEFQILNSLFLQQSFDP